MRRLRLERLLAATLIAVVPLALSMRDAFASGVEDGKKYLKERQWQKAADAFQAALKDSPSSRDAALGLATAAAEGRVSDAYDAATNALSTALRANKEDRELRLAYGYLFLARATLDERWRADAQEQFQRLLKANPDDDAATIGLARYYYFGGDYPRGLELLDGLIAKKAGHADAHYWKGMLLYDEAEQASKAGNAALSTPLFSKAADAFDVAAKAQPTRAESWMRLAYARHYLVASDRANAEKAEAAYLKALDADPADALPLAGLQSLLASSSTKDAYPTLLARLVKEKASYPAVQFEHAQQLRASGKIDEAVAVLRSHVASSRAPHRVWFDIGEMLRGKGDDEGASKAYRECLRAAPISRYSETAVGWLTVPLQARGQDAVASYPEMKKLEKEYDAILALSPKSMAGHNNVAFFLREAYKSPAGRGHDDLFESCVAHYVAASEAIGEFTPAQLAFPYADRAAFAQVLNDTGLMFDTEAKAPDLEKAESYYQRAMDWTENGYWDAYGNLRKLYEKQGKLEKALDLAETCAESIKKEDGTPQPDFRRICEGDAQRLKKQLGK